MKEKLYRKEIWITVIFSVLLLLMGHSASIFVLFPGLQTGTMWGFPIQYIVPILLGWFGMAVVCLVKYPCRQQIGLLVSVFQQVSF